MPNAARFEVTGVKAVVVFAVFLGFAGWRSVTARADLDAGASEAIAQTLRAEYARDAMSGIGAARELTPARVDSLLAMQNVAFESIRARGTPDDMVVRVEVRVNGLRPSDGEPVRYYEMSHSALTGWHIERETTAISFYLRLF